MENVTPQAIIAIYFLVFLGGMMFKRFRDSFLEWFSLRDPIGMRFWFGNVWFLVFTIIYFATAAFFLI